MAKMSVPEGSYEVVRTGRVGGFETAVISMVVKGQRFIVEMVCSLATLGKGFFLPAKIWTDGTEKPIWEWDLLKEEYLVHGVGRAMMAMANNVPVLVLLENKKDGTGKWAVSDVIQLKDMARPPKSSKNGGKKVSAEKADALLRAAMSVKRLAANSLRSAGCEAGVIYSKEENDFAERLFDEDRRRKDAEHMAAEEKRRREELEQKEERRFADEKKRREEAEKLAKKRERKERDIREFEARPRLTVYLEDGKAIGNCVPSAPGENWQVLKDGTAVVRVKSFDHSTSRCGQAISVFWVQKDPGGAVRPKDEKPAHFMWQKKDSVAA